MIWKDSRSRLSFGFLAVVPVFVACDDIEESLLDRKVALVKKLAGAVAHRLGALEVSVPVGTLEGARNFFLLAKFSIHKGSSVR